MRLVAEEGVDLARIVSAVLPLEEVVERGFAAEPEGGHLRLLVAPGG
ncbi:hypothetical protein [Streptomyces sp. ODS28]